MYGHEPPKIMRTKRRGKLVSKCHCFRSLKLILQSRSPPEQCVPQENGHVEHTVWSNPIRRNSDPNILYITFLMFCEIKSIPNRVIQIHSHPRKREEFNLDHLLQVLVVRSALFRFCCRWRNCTRSPRLTTSTGTFNNFPTYFTRLSLLMIVWLEIGIDN